MTACHAALLNDIIWRGLTKSESLTTKEQAWLVRSNGRHPDEVTLIPWDGSRCLVWEWDATVIDPLAESYRTRSAEVAGSAADKKNIQIRGYFAIILPCALGFLNYGPSGRGWPRTNQTPRQPACRIIRKQQRNNFSLSALIFEHRAFERFNAIAFCSTVECTYKTICEDYPFQDQRTLFL